ncbi:MAG: hypothetical protein ACFWT4_25110 [Citrobacter braakii]
MPVAGETHHSIDGLFPPAALRHLHTVKYGQQTTEPGGSAYQMQGVVNLLDCPCDTAMQRRVSDASQQNKLRNRQH